MGSRIALVGVPIETVPVQEEPFCVEAYLPGVTDRTRSMIIRKAAERGIKVEDLGEVSAGTRYQPEFTIDRLAGVPFLLLPKIPSRDMQRLEEERELLLARSRGLDLLVAVGASHLGAIVLYDAGDVVARLDYHSDFADSSNVPFGSASYMDWVKANVRPVDVTNFFVRQREKGVVFGRESPDGKAPPGVNHFDIDVDCFDLRLQIQNVYPHSEGSSGVTPELVLSMIGQSKPRKLGIWEYRPSGDYNRAGLDFIVRAIETAVS